MAPKKRRVRVSVRVEEDGVWKESLFHMDHATFVVDKDWLPDRNATKVIISGLARKVLEYKWPSS